MLHSAHLYNFQCYQDREFTFAPGLNLVVGPSNTGKTALVRAMRWCAWNEPRRGVDSLKRVGSQETWVRLQFDDGAVTRTTEHNSYLLEVNGEMRQFARIGHQVPDEVQAFLRMERLSLAGSELEVHLASQLDPLFLVAQPPAALLGALSTLARVETLQAALRLVTAEHKREQQECERLDRQAEKLKEQLSTWDWLEGEQVLLQRAEQAMQQRDALCEKLRALEQLREQRERLMQPPVELSRVDSILTEYEWRIEQLQKLEGVQKELFRQEAQGEQLSAETRRAEAELARVQGELVAMVGELCPTCGQELTEEALG